MYMFLTQVEGYSLPVEGPEGESEYLMTPASAFAVGMLEGMPFFIREDGTYESDLNRFFRGLASDGAPAFNTWLAYAKDILVYVRFLSQVRGKGWLDADIADLRAYKVARRTPKAPHFYSASSWNRALAAIQRLYQWALDEELIGQLPFRLRRNWRSRVRDGGAPLGAGTYRNILRDSHVGGEGISYVSESDYRYFRDVGLLGRLPDGTQDRSWDGINGARNAAMADLLVTTGMRLVEAASLLIWEIHSLDGLDLGEGRFVEHKLGPAVSKTYPRRIFIPLRVHRRIREYIECERENALEQALGASGRYFGIKMPILVCQVRRDKCRLVDEDRYRSLGTFSPRERIRLVVECRGGPEQPAWLFLSEKGTPLRSWNKVVSAANERCAHFGRPLHITPRALRHTFAVHYLSWLIRETVGAASARDLSNPGTRAYQRLIGDPLRILQKRLGHRQITTTFMYLDYLREAREIADSAADAWAEEIA
jgi:site-specific recombinase XerD